MVVYGAASAGVAALIQPIFDEVLPTRRATRLRDHRRHPRSLLVKGIGAYLSGYLMTDVGQRVVRDLRNVLFRHILGQSAAFFSRQTTGRLMSRITNDVGAGAARGVGDDRRPGARVAGAGRLRRRCSFYYDARLAIVCLTGAPLVVYPLVRLGQRVRRTTRRSQEALEQMSHVSAEAFTGHRIVKAFGAEAARGGEVRARLASTSTAPT